MAKGMRCGMEGQEGRTELRNAMGEPTWLHLTNVGRTMEVSMGCVCEVGPAWAQVPQVEPHQSQPRPVLTSSRRKGLPRVEELQRFI
jgi:hypothetical protein